MSAKSKQVFLGARYIILWERLSLGVTVVEQTDVTEPDRRGLHRRAPCSRVYLAYSLCQLRVGISPPYALDPYDRSRNVL